MSKKNNKGKKRKNTKPEKKTFSPKALVIGIVFAVLVIGGVTAAVIIHNNMPESVDNTSWVSVSAKNASTDEPVELSEVYNVYYSNFQGRLEFKDDNKLELWLSTGDPSDGTHTGTYTTEGDKIKVKFDDETEKTYKIERSGRMIKDIIVDYYDYKVTFEREKAANND